VPAGYSNFGRLGGVSIVDRPELGGFRVGQLQVGGNELLLLRADIPSHQLDGPIGDGWGGSRLLRLLRESSALHDQSTSQNQYCSKTFLQHLLSCHFAI